MPITTTSPLPNAIQLISCDFDKDFCGWNSNNKWMRTNEDFSKLFGRYGIINKINLKYWDYYFLVKDILVRLQKL